MKISTQGPENNIFWLIQLSRVEEYKSMEEQNTRLGIKLGEARQFEEVSLPNLL